MDKPFGHFLSCVADGGGGGGGGGGDGDNGGGAFVLQPLIPVFE